MFTACGVIPPHMQAAYASMGLSPDDLPVARDLSNQVLSLPMGPHLDAASVKIVTQTILNGGANA